jgi:hypothetical protein
MQPCQLRSVVWFQLPIAALVVVDDMALVPELTEVRPVPGVFEERQGAAVLGDAGDVVPVLVVACERVAAVRRLPPGSTVGGSA